MGDEKTDGELKPEASDSGSKAAAGKTKPEQCREERLAEALRANLRRRKSAAKSRDTKD